MTKTQPIAQLLAALHGARGRTVTTDHLRNKIAAYREGEPGRRRLQRDLNVLGARGLVVTAITDDIAGNRDGVRLVRCDKPALWHLNVQEHAVLTRARREFRRGALTVSALPDGPDSPEVRALDELMRLLRIVEEHGANQGHAQADPMRVGELAGLLGVTRDRVVDLIREADDLRDTGLFPGLLVAYGEDSDTDELGEELAADNDDVTAVAIIRTAARPRSNPTLGLGLDELGRFAYTARECRDRLDLLREARDAWGPEDPDDFKVERAYFKLESWFSSLPRPSLPHSTEPVREPTRLTEADWVELGELLDLD